MTDGSSASQPCAVPELSEAAATGKTAEIYDDIRATLGVPLVNLIYRHLATVPGALEWAWHALRPHFASGALAAQGAQLRDIVRMQTEHLCTGLALDAPNPEITTLLTVYNAANSQNLMALTHLLGLGAVGADPLPTAAAGLPARAQAQPPNTSLRPLPRWEALCPVDRAAALRLNQYGESGAPQILASLYRHLGAWPGLLPRLEQALAPLHGGGQLVAARLATVSTARRIAGLHALSIATAGPPGATDLVQRLHGFANVTIPKMVPIGLALRASLAHAPVSSR